MNITIANITIVLSSKILPTTTDREIDRLENWFSGELNMALRQS